MHETLIVVTCIAIYYNYTMCEQMQAVPLLPPKNEKKIVTTVLAPMLAFSHAMMAIIRTALELGAVKMMDHGMVILCVKVS